MGTSGKRPDCFKTSARSTLHRACRKTNMPSKVPTRQPNRADFGPEGIQFSLPLSATKVGARTGPQNGTSEPLNDTQSAPQGTQEIQMGAKITSTIPHQLTFPSRKGLRPVSTCRPFALPPPASPEMEGLSLPSQASRSYRLGSGARKSLIQISGIMTQANCFQAG